MTELERARSEIDAIDAQMAVLFEQRMHAAARIAEEKRRHGLPISDPAREQQVLSAGAQALADPALTDYYRDWMRRTVMLSKDRQAELFLDQLASQCFFLPGKQSDLVVERGALRSLHRFLDTARRALLVTDDGVPAAYVEAVCAQWASPDVNLHVVTVPQGEASKCISRWQSLLQTMQQSGFTRGDCVLALGGGMICDLAGFAAATYQRGIDCYCVPTTLLAQIDASVGGKTALDLGGVKNQIGVFSQPRRVIIDPDLLLTLPARQLANGLAEALKIAVCFDPALFSLFESQDLTTDPTPVIAPCLRHKRRLVLEDERDEGSRALLNFGHTLGHGLEAVTGLLHGECVALGMLPMCSAPLRARLLPVLTRLGLPTQISADADAVLAAVSGDKKRHPAATDEDAQFTAVLADRPGDARLVTLSQSELRRRLETVLCGKA